MDVISKVGHVYDPQTLELMQFFVPSYIPYPRLHRWIIFPFECPTMETCFLLVAYVTLGRE
jgi:hypothetical protein